MTTIDEAIKHAEEVAEENERQYKGCPMKYDGNYCYGTSAGECAAEHRQVAEWLKELVRYRKALPEIKEEIEQLWKKEPCAIKHGCLDEVLEIIGRHLKEVGE